MLSFTVDTNCIVAIDENRPEARFVRALANAHKMGKADVAAVAISASEKQQSGAYMDSFKEFQERLTKLDLDHLNIVKPMTYWGIAFWDWSYYSSEDSIALEKRIHAILFPSIEFEWKEYCLAHGLDHRLPPNGKWRNCKCDVQAMWSHVNANREVFVTSDGNFHTSGKKGQLIALGAKKIETPENAIGLIK